MLLAERHTEKLNSAAGPEDKFKNPARQWVVQKMIAKIIVFSLCLIVANLVIQSLAVKRIREIKDLQAEISSLERDAAKLRVEMAELESFNRIQAIAQKELNMRPAGPKDFQFIAAAPGYNYKKEKSAVSGQDQANSLKPVPRDSLWNQLAAWLGGTNKTMADTP
ncbi:MAG: cell division protein FtsL [Firmicutes bacterium]|nr:cell division protein FtsL [Bacillota bacterium]